MSAFQVALVAVASSLVTVGTIELLRGSASGAQESLAGETPSDSVAASVPGEAPAPVTPALDAPADYAERLAGLERRIAELELAVASRRSPIEASDEPSPREEMRDQILDWVAAERQAELQAQKLANTEKRRAEIDYGARHQAMMLAQEYGLEKWQEDEFAALFLKIGLRADEIEKTIDVKTDDPEKVEARWTEYDEWVDQLERELTARLDPELYEEIYGDD